jgi:hypothetical protein
MAFTRAFVARSRSIVLVSFHYRHRVVNEQTQLETSCRFHRHRAWQARETPRCFSVGGDPLGDERRFACVPTRCDMSPVELPRVVPRSPDLLDLFPSLGVAKGHAPTPPTIGPYLRGFELRYQGGGSSEKGDQDAQPLSAFRSRSQSA